MMKSTFAHAKVGKMLHSMGICGWFSFNLTGIVADLRYCMVQSAKKLDSDLDKAPFTYPPTSFEKLLAEAKKETPAMDSRNRSIAEHPEKKAKVRAHLTFAELTNLFIENNVRPATV